MVGLGLPQSLASVVRFEREVLLGRGVRLEEETPLFAARREFAWEHGGPITRAFLEALPDTWGEGVLVDSHLAWLGRGLALDDALPRHLGAPQRNRPHYRHERHLGWRAGVRGAANANLACRFRSLTVGGAAPEFLVGDVQLGPGEDALEFWIPERDFEARDERLFEAVRQGTLRLQEAPPNAIVAHAWGTFWRPRPARRPGFQFRITAVHGDRSPAADALRNVTFT